VITDLATAERWHRRVLNALNSGEMPPDDEQQPTSDAKADFTATILRTSWSRRARASAISVA